MELRDLKGIGQKRLSILKENDIETPPDLLRHFPQGYIDSTFSTPIANIIPGTAVCIDISFVSNPSLQYIRGLSIVRAQAQDESGSIRIIWFNQPWNKGNYKEGDRALLYGRAEFVKGKLTFSNPKVVKERGILPQYAAIGSISGSLIASLIGQLLPDLEELCPETLSERLLKLWKLCDLQSALREVHLPQSTQSLLIAKQRVAFENLLLYQLALRSLRGNDANGIALQEKNEVTQQFWKGTGFEPTGAQKRVLSDILKDLAGGRSMRRLVQGDVGCGKTAIAFAAVAVMAQNQYQTALMVPTEILARQHLKSAQDLLAPLGIRSGLLLGGMKSAQRAEALSNISDGTWDLVIGTQALFSDGVRYKDLGLVITDEQHRFGVRQRQRLSNKAEGEQPAHVLVMSATPIPRTLALILYGDLDVSVVDELPPGRKAVKTRIVAEDKRMEMYRFIREKVALNQQAYLVCPLVQESEQIEAKDAQAMYEDLRKGPLKGLKLGLTWGSQPAAQKEEVISAFSQGEIDVLVATTVIEVGVNVPRATVMVIENADRFGLSQLHQLRGRVGRGAEESWCFLMGEANERLKTLCATNDGFAVAQKDLELRGPGEFLGTRQHGRLMPNGFGVQDMHLIQSTKEAAQMLSLDASLHEEEAMLRLRALKLYQKALSEIALH